MDDGNFTLFDSTYIYYQLCDRHLCGGSEAKQNRQDFCSSEFTFYRGLQKTKQK